MVAKILSLASLYICVLGSTLPVQAMTTQERIESLEKELSSIKSQIAISADAPPHTSSLARKLKVNGYANMVLSRSSEETSYWSDEKNDLSVSNHSSAGIRLTGLISDVTNVVMQFSVLPVAAALSNDAGGYDTGVEWFYIQHRFTDKASMKAGRISLPVLAYSEEFEVGFAHLWIRPPEEVYGPLPLSEIDGISFVYDTYLGELGVQTKATWGYNNWEFKHIPVPGFDVENISIEESDIYGIDISLSYGNFSFRAAQMRMEILATLTVRTVFSSLIDTSTAVGSATTSDIVVEDTDYKLSSLGFTYDNSTFIITSEASQYEIENHGFFFDEQGYYLTFGYYLKKWMPYYTYAYTESDPDKNLRTQRGQYVGVRYNLTRKSVLTFQVQYFDSFKESDGLFSDTIDFKSTKIINLAYQTVF